MRLQPGDAIPEILFWTWKNRTHPLYMLYIISSDVFSKVNDNYAPNFQYSPNDVTNIHWERLNMFCVLLQSHQIISGPHESGTSPVFKTCGFLCIGKAVCRCVGKPPTIQSFSHV